MLPLPPKLASIHRLVELSHQLEKVAGEYAQDAEVRDRALTVKIGVDHKAFKLIKEAASPLAWGLGVGIPATLGGALLVNHAANKYQETAADIRNKVLQTGAGLAAIGGGLYGMHRMMDRPQSPPMGVKQSAAEPAGIPEDALEKLATVGVIEDMLSNLPGDLPEDVTKLAAEMCLLNRGYGMQLLYELGHDE